METALQTILRKSGAVQHALLRVTRRNKKLSLSARAGSSASGDRVNCVINMEEYRGSLLSRNVNLIQKDKGDYLYLTCRVKDEVQKDNMMVVSMEVIRACWFTREMSGGLSWLQEKYVYQAFTNEVDIAC